MKSEQPSGSRSRSRLFIVQALYQYLLSGASEEVLSRQFRADDDFSRANEAYFDRCLSGVFAHEEEILSKLDEVMDLSMTEVRPVEQAVLRLGVYELMFELDVPVQVVINEALELTKAMGAAEGYRYVNGVLDQVAKIVRV